MIITSTGKYWIRLIIIALLWLGVVALAATEMKHLLKNLHGWRWAVAEIGFIATIVFLGGKISDSV